MDVDCARAGRRGGVGHGRPRWGRWGRGDLTLLAGQHLACRSPFGRTARINGTNGTDHGQGTVAFLAGGALKGGRMIADWPGLKESQLYEARDLKPTTDLRAVLKGLLRDHLRVEERALADVVFPGSSDVAPMGGLVG